MTQNKFDLMRESLDEARTVMRAADVMAGDMAFLLRGRLRKVPANTLAALKKELREFNAATREWKS